MSESINSMSHALERAGFSSKSHEKKISFGDSLTKEMSRTKMTLNEVKEQSGVPVDVIKKLMHGKTTIDYRTLQRISRALPKFKHYSLDAMSFLPKNNILENKTSESSNTNSTPEADKIMNVETIPQNGKKKSEPKFHELFAHEMKAADVSVPEISKLLDASTSTVYNWKSGNTFPSQSSMAKIGDLFPALKDFPIPKHILENPRLYNSHLSLNQTETKAIKSEKKKDGSKSKVSNSKVSEPDRVLVGATSYDPVNDKKAAFKLGVMISKIDNKEPILNILRTAKNSSLSLSEILQLFEEME